MSSCCLIGACGRRYRCLCVNVYLACRTAVGKRSENPRSCWKEMIGFRTWWPLCDRWLGAGLAEPKSPTHICGLPQACTQKHTHAYTRQHFKIPLHNPTCMSTCEYKHEEHVVFTYLLLAKMENPEIENRIFTEVFQ